MTRAPPPMPLLPPTTARPGRRGDRVEPSSVVAMASVVVLLSSVFIHVPPPGCFVPTTLAVGAEVVFAVGAIPCNTYGFAFIGVRPRTATRWIAAIAASQARYATSRAQDLRPSP